MSLLSRGTTGLSGLTINSDKDWLGHLIKNLGAPIDDNDALRKQDAVLKSLLTEAGQLIYASAPGTPAALAPQSGEKFLKAGAPPSWADLPASGSFWQLAGQTTLAVPQNIIEVTDIPATYELLWIIFMCTATGGWDINLRFNPAATQSYYYSRFEFADAYSKTAVNNGNSVTFNAPGGQGSLLFLAEGLVVQRLAGWRKTFTINWAESNSSNGSNTRQAVQGYWNDQTSRITTVRFIAGTSGTFDVNTKLIVLGA